MSMYDTVNGDIKQAMLAKNTVKRDVLRSLMSDIKNATVNAGKEITDDAVLKCVNKAVKQHRDSIEQFKTAGREDLFVRESEELTYLEAYLPKMMDESELRVVINNILQSIEATKKNMGLIMKQLPKDADRKMASQILNGILK